MSFSLNFIPATIKAVTMLVEALDRHRFGAVMLVVVMLVGGGVVVGPSVVAVFV